MKNARILEGNCLDVMRDMADCSVDAIVTDPPYGLKFMAKKWDHDVPRVEIWREALRVLKPGGHLLAFFGSRTYHRGVVNIEDAGFDIRDQIMWVYGSGFPKSSNISKAIDRAVGATPEAEKWDGWGTALKPAHEPIVMARKPFKGPCFRNVLEHGTGAINIDDCRIGCEKSDFGDPSRFQYARKGSDSWDQETNMFSAGREGFWSNGVPSGRWPANLIHDGSDEVIEQFPQNNPGKMRRNKTKGARPFNNQGKPTEYETAEVIDDPGGSAARFFYCAKASRSEREKGRWPANLIHDGSEEVIEQFPESKSAGIYKDPLGDCKKRKGSGSTVFAGLCAQNIGGRRRTARYSGETGSAARFFYCAKASRSEREKGLDGIEAIGGHEAVGRKEGSKGMDSPRAGAGRTSKEVRNKHPTVKPIKLMEYLVKLVTPPGGVVFDPFTGSGTTGIACVLQGFEFIGAEMDPDYCKIARARVEAHQKE